MPTNFCGFLEINFKQYVQTKCQIMNKQQQVK